MFVLQTFGEYLEALRGKISLREIAKRIGISHTYIRDLELGKKTDPSIETLTKLAKTYDVPLDDMITKAYIKTIDVSYDEALKLIEEENELRKKKDILHLLENKDGNVYYNGQMLSPDDRQKVLTVLSALLSEYHKD